MSANSGGYNTRLSPRAALAGAMVLALILIGNGVVAIAWAIERQHIGIAAFLVLLLVIAFVLLVRLRRTLMRKAALREPSRAGEA